MRIPHDARILVADGAKMLFFRNEGDAEHLDLRVVDAEQQADPADRDIKTDAAGRTSGGGTMGETDFHQQAEDRFAASAAAMLNRAALANEFDHLVVVAPPKTLGELRKHYHKQLVAKISGEVPKDLTGHSVDKIQTALTNLELALS